MLVRIKFAASVYFFIVTFNHHYIFIIDIDLDSVDTWFPFFIYPTNYFGVNL